MLNMESLLTNKNKHLLWVDELGDDFVLSKICRSLQILKKDPSCVLLELPKGCPID